VRHEIVSFRLSDGEQFAPDAGDVYLLLGRSGRGAAARRQCESQQAGDGCPGSHVTSLGIVRVWHENTPLELVKKW
jgi:hypothetical protein